MIMNNTRMYCKLLDTLRPFAFSCLETKQRQYVTLSSTVIKFHLCIVGDAVPFDNHISITTPLMGGEGQNVTVHFNVCKTSRLEN